MLFRSAASADNWVGTNPTLDVTALREGLAPLSGTFRVGFSGHRTPPLPASISAEGMEAALEALTTVEEVTVVRSINNNGHNWRVSFLSQAGPNLPMLETDDSQLTGPNARARVTTGTSGTAHADHGSYEISDPSTHAHLITGLETGLPYFVRVKACDDSEGCGAFVTASPAPVAPVAAPSRPQSVALYPVSLTALKLVWNEPADSGGLPVVRYLVEWDIEADFSNIGTSGYRHELVVDPDDGPTFHYNIPITSVSSQIPRFARVSAYNTFWSHAAYPTPRSATGKLLPPDRKSVV